MTCLPVLALLVLQPLVLAALPALAGPAAIVWDDDKTVSGNETYDGARIIMKGNLTITGSLTLKNVDLAIDGARDCLRRIVVEDGGSLAVLASSDIHSTDADVHFGFQVRAAARLMMNASGLHDCGWEDWENYTYPSRGLYIESSDACITNCTISGNYIGIIVDNASSPYIYRNNISENDGVGIAVLSASMPTIAHNTVHANVASNSMYWGAGIYSEVSSPIVENNTVADNIDTAWGNTYGIFASGGTVYIANNTVTGHRDPFGYSCGMGMALYICSGTVSGNNVSGNDNGIALENGDLLLEDNRIGDTDKNMGVGMLDNGAGVCRRNTYHHNFYGIMLEQDSLSYHENETFEWNEEGIDGDGQISQFQNTFADCVFKNNDKDVALTAPWNLRAGGIVTLVRPSYDPDKVSVTDGNSMLVVMWELKIKVAYESTGTGAAAAWITITDAQGKPVESFAAGPDGCTDVLLLEEYRCIGMYKRGSSPFNITAALGNFSSCVPQYKLECSGNITILLDDAAPALDLFSPANGTITNKTVVTVTGRCEPGAELRVNGSLVPLEWNGAWSALVELPLEGANEISVAARDSMLNTVRRSITVIRDTVVPAIQVDGPADGFLVNTSTVNISGIASEHWANLTVNGLPVQADAEGRFSLVFNLIEGKNTIEIQATDAAGNTAVVLRRGVSDTILPFVRVVEPASNTATNSSFINVIGQVEAAAALVVNGLVLPVCGTSFEWMLELKEGGNFFVFAARDGAGNVNTTVLEITKDSVPPAVNIAFPLPGASLNRSSVELTGSTEPGVHLRVDGKAVVNVGGEFNVSLELKEGANSIVVESSDELGNMQRLVIGVMVDTTPPSLAILGPANRTLCNRTAVEIYGMTEPGAGVMVDGQLTVGNATGRFSALVALPAEGQNDIRVSAWDGLLNTAWLNITVLRDTVARFNITSPAAGAKIKGGTAAVQGTAEPNSTIRIAGVVVFQAADGSFSASVALAAGQNIINVSVQDAAGNTGTMDIVLTRAADSSGPAGPGPAAIVGAAALVGACVLAAAFVARKRP